MKTDHSFPHDIPRNPVLFFDMPPHGVTDLYRRMGRALWYCQCFEEALAYHLCLLYDLPRGTAEDIANRTLADKRRRTLGRLVREVAKKAAPAIPPKLEERLLAFTEERNWLAHRIQTENHTDLYHRARFIRLLERIDALKSEAQALTRLFGAFLDDWSESQGFTQAEVSRRMWEQVRNWRRH